MRFSQWSLYGRCTAMTTQGARCRNVAYGYTPHKTMCKRHREAQMRRDDKEAKR